MLDSGESFDSMIDYYKVFIDVVKSITALSAGILVLLATFHEKLSTGAHYPWLIVVSMICFLFSIIHNVTLCYNSIFIIGEYGHDKTVSRIGDNNEILARLKATNATVGRLERKMRIGLRASHWAFVIGILSIGAFVTINFWTPQPALNRSEANQRSAQSQTGIQQTPPPSPLPKQDVGATSPAR